MLLQAVIGAGLEALEDFSIGSLDLSTTLWMINRHIADFDTKILAISLEHTTDKPGHVVSDDPIRDPKPVNDGLYELDCRLLVDLDHRGCFRPPDELVYGDVLILESFDDPREWT
jgi:hypothetical protein